jgi:isocitrate dehydrogenase
LRQVLDLYAGARPAHHIEGIPSPVANPENVDMVVFLENTENVYIGYEWEADSPMARKLIGTIKKKKVTYDLTRQMAGAEEVSCSAFAQIAVSSMSAQPSD